jgi:hypothetical protein
VPAGTGGAIVDVQHFSACRLRVAEHPVDSTAAALHRRQQTQPIEHRKPGRLQYEAGSHGFRPRKTFDKSDVVALAVQDKRRRQASRAATDDDCPDMRFLARVVISAGHAPMSRPRFVNSPLYHRQPR